MRRIKKCHVFTKTCVCKYTGDPLGHVHLVHFILSKNEEVNLKLCSSARARPRPPAPFAPNDVRMHHVISNKATSFFHLPCLALALRW